MAAAIRIMWQLMATGWVVGGPPGEKLHKPNIRAIRGMWYFRRLRTLLIKIRKQRRDESVRIVIVSPSQRFPDIVFELIQVS